MDEKTVTKRIEAYCPRCFASNDKIVFQNSGPIVRIYCSVCGLVYNDKDAWDNGFSNLIDYWNHIGVNNPDESDLNGGGYQTDESVRELINILMTTETD